MTHLPVSGPNSHLVKDKSGTTPTDVTQPGASLCSSLLLCRVKQTPLTIIPDYSSCHKLLSLLLLLVCFPENSSQQMFANAESVREIVVKSRFQYVVFFFFIPGAVIEYED